MELKVYNIDGGSSGNSVALPKEVFDVEPNSHLIYLAVRSQMKNSRQGTVSTKNRSAVRGGGRKPWKQKGRGSARAGTSRSPIWVGGGRTFGPQPRDLSMKLSKKMKKSAKASAYSSKAKDDKVIVIEDFILEQQKTKEVYNILKNLKIQDKKVLLLTSNNDSILHQCGNNIPMLNIRSASDASTYDIVYSEIVLVQNNAIEKLKEVCSAC